MNREMIARVEEAVVPISRKIDDAMKLLLSAKLDLEELYVVVGLSEDEE